MLFHARIIALGCLIFLISCQSKTNDKLTVAVAANVQFAMDSLALVFEQQNGVEINIITGSSGKLTAQIVQGAPFDVFLSADMKYPEEIYKKGIALNKPRTYAYGSLVLWTLKEDIDLYPGILQDQKIKRIAVANPRTAPYGVSAIAYLKNLGLYEQVKDKLIFGESIAQVNQFITSKTADLGFTAESVIKGAKIKDRGHWIRLDPSKYPPLEQGIVLINAENDHTNEAEAFFSFILSSQARNILTEFGYKTEFQ